MSASRMSRMRGSSTANRSSSSRCASATSVTACTCSTRFRARALGLECPRVLDRDRRTVGRRAATARHRRSSNTRCVSAPTWRTPSTRPRDEQRDAEHRLDPLLAQDRVEHVRVIDVVEDHRPPFRGDAAGESAADRDADALLHLLLDPDRRPRDELVRLLVEQQDRARVDIEDLAGPEKERRQQRVELQMRERRIRERLKTAKAIGLLARDFYLSATPFRRPRCTCSPRRKDRRRARESISSSPTARLSKYRSFREDGGEAEPEHRDDSLSTARGGPR